MLDLKKCDNAHIDNFIDTLDQCQTLTDKESLLYAVITDKEISGIEKMSLSQIVLKTYFKKV